ncbi:MAG: hypothetical protein SU899_01160 [Chloroflexota bacterium]|nr:hypothetical protein [Chloroflexota bacterium]
MEQIHKRFTTEPVGALLRGYCRGTLDRATVEEILEIGKTRFFALLRQSLHDTDTFSVTNQRTTPDDFSRKLLYADLLEYETTRVHIKVSEAFCLDHLSYQSHIPQPRMSSAYERKEWSTGIEGYLCSIMK